MKHISVTITAIIVIAGLLAWANYLGVNGVALAAGCSLIAGLGGFSVSKLRGGKNAKHRTSHRKY